MSFPTGLGISFIIGKIPTLIYIREYFRGNDKMKRILQNAKSCLSEDELI